MAFIAEFLPGDKCLQLGQEQAIRALPFGPNWTKIRISVMLSINGMSNLDAAKGLYIGVCTGAKAIYDNDCIDAIYASCFGFSSGSTYNTAGYLTGNSGNSVGPVQKVGTTTQTFSSQLVFSSQRVAAPPSLFRTLNMFDFTKNLDGTMTYYGYYYTTLTDTLRSAYTLAIENTATPTGMTAANQSYACPLRTVKDWNATFISWPLGLPTVNVYAWSITRFG